jgi:sarcosine oxidase subunit gamma
MVEPARRQLPNLPALPWLEAAPPAQRFAFYGDGAARLAAQPIWGAAFSEQALRARTHATRATLWLGPDEYLLLDFATDAASGGGEPVFAALERALAAVPHALVDISHRQFAFEVGGPHAVEILNGACPLDLDIAEFPIGMCTRTVLSKAEIVLWRTQENAFHLEVWRSFAGYVAGLLQEIASEFYPTARP